MRVRWGRVSAALVGCGLTGFGLLVGALGATAPEPGPVRRVTPADRDCVTGDVLEGVPTTSVYGILDDLVEGAPTPKELYEHVASRVGSAGWGQVALTVGPDHHPSVLPLRAAFELRPVVVAAEAEHGLTSSDRASLAATALRAAIE